MLTMVHGFFKGRTQCRELPLCAGSGEGCQWQALPSPVQCEETAIRTWDLPVTGSKTLPLAPKQIGVRPITDAYFLVWSLLKKTLTCRWFYYLKQIMACILGPFCTGKREFSWTLLLFCFLAQKYLSMIYFCSMIVYCFAMSEHFSIYV